MSFVAKSLKAYENAKLIFGMIFMSIILITGLFIIFKDKTSTKKKKTISTLSLVTFCILVLFLQYYLLTKTSNQTKSILGGLSLVSNLTKQ